MLRDGGGSVGGVSRPVGGGGNEACWRMRAGWAGVGEEGERGDAQGSGKFDDGGEAGVAVTGFELGDGGAGNTGRGGKVVLGEARPEAGGDEVAAEDGVDGRGLFVQELIHMRLPIT